MNFTATALCTQSPPATEPSPGRVAGGNSSSPRTRASRAAAVESQRAEAAAAHSDTLAGLSEASIGAWGVKVLKCPSAPPRELTEATHVVSVGPQRTSRPSLGRARTCGVVLGQLKTLLASSESALGWRAEAG